MHSRIQLSRMTAGNTCDFGLCEADTVGGKHIPAAIALNVTPQNGYTNHYICRPHLIGLIETILDDPEYGPIARKIAKEKINEYAESDALALAEEEAKAVALAAEKEAAALSVEKQTYPCRKCGKLIKNPAARDIHETHCKVIPADVKVETGDLETPADFKETYGDKEAEGAEY